MSMEKKRKRGKSKKTVNDREFYNLADSIRILLERNNGGKPPNRRDFTKQQKEQVEEMLELECQFKECILKYRQSDKVYQQFVMLIKSENNNILTARPYFREKSNRFGIDISKAFKEEDIEKIKSFDINYKLMKFIVDNWKGSLPKRAQELWERHQVVRQRLIESSMPLAINRAMIFYRSTPQSHVTLMDLINASIAGLAAGCDKWVGPFSTVFRSVCIGRMTGNMLELYNQSFLHYYPSDKKILYKVNILKSREKIDDADVLLEEINKYLADGGDNRKFSSNDLQNLLNSSTMLSMDSEADTQDDNSFNVKNIHNMYSDGKDTELEVEKVQILRKISAESSNLSVIERKVLRLKGVDI